MPVLLPPEPTMRCVSFRLRCVSFRLRCVSFCPEPTMLCLSFFLFWLPSRPCGACPSALPLPSEPTMRCVSFRPSAHVLLPGRSDEDNSRDEAGIAADGPPTPRIGGRAADASVSRLAVFLVERNKWLASSAQTPENIRVAVARASRIRRAVGPCDPSNDCSQGPLSNDSSRHSSPRYEHIRGSLLRRL
jgi:hypothetical protein